MNQTSALLLAAGAVGIEYVRQRPRADAPKTPADDADPPREPVDAGTAGSIDGTPPPGAASGDPAPDGGGGLIDPFERRAPNNVVPPQFQGIGAIARAGAAPCCDPPIKKESRPMTQAEIDAFRRSRGRLE